MFTVNRGVGATRTVCCCYVMILKKNQVRKLISRGTDDGERMQPKYRRLIVSRMQTSALLPLMPPQTADAVAISRPRNAIRCHADAAAAVYPFFTLFSSAYTYAIH